MVKAASALLGLIAAVWSYSWFDAKLVAPLAFLACVALGIVVYLLSVAILSEVTNSN